MTRNLFVSLTMGILMISGHLQHAVASPVGKTFRAESGRHIKVSNCDGGLGMTIVKSTDASHVGKQIMCGAEQTGDNQWSGTILNVDDGKSYTGKASLSGDVLSVSGCILGGLICKTQKWPLVN